METPLSHSTDSRLAPAPWPRPGSAMAASWERSSAHGRWLPALEPGTAALEPGTAGLEQVMPWSRGSPHLPPQPAGAAPHGAASGAPRPLGRPAPAPMRAAAPPRRCVSRGALAWTSFGLRFVAYFTLFLRKQKSRDGVVFLAGPLHGTFVFSFGTVSTYHSCAHLRIFKLTVVIQATIKMCILVLAAFLSVFLWEKIVVVPCLK